MVKSEKLLVDKYAFDCRVSGNKKDELVILLHGFPETSFMWKPLLPEVSKLGFYCVAPNMRGYSKDATPRGKKQYTIDKLCQDVLNLAKATGKEKFHLVAHDWGAAIGWYLVYHHSDHILSWTSLSVPHIAAFAKAITTDNDQIKKSRYIKNFQIRFLPEMKIRKNDFALFRKLWKNSSKDEIEDYLSVFRTRKSLTAAINYYRANYKLFLKPSINEIKAPTLFIWGKHDLAIGSNSVKNNHQYMKGYYKFIKLDAGHWLMQTEFETLKKEIVGHLLKFKLK